MGLSFSKKKNFIDINRSIKRPELFYEAMIYDYLKNNNIQIRIMTQYMIDYYIVDFYLPDYAIYLEVDCAEHFGSNNPESKSKLYKKDLDQNLYFIANNLLLGRICYHDIANDRFESFLRFLIQNKNKFKGMVVLSSEKHYQGEFMCRSICDKVIYAS